MPMSDFDWDDANREHLAQHGVQPHEAEETFRNDPVDLEVQEDDDDGYRYKQIGETNAGRILVVMSTVRKGRVRIITAWDAPKAYKILYLEMKASQ
jgi:uncharacterized protein